MDDQQNNQTDNDQVSLEKLQSDLDQAMSGWKRTAADFENYKKRKEAENKELIEFAREVTVAKLLPTLDALEQALKHLPEVSDQWTVNSEQAKDFAKKYQNWQTGINGIVMQLDKVLGELGVQKTEAIGKKFDPHFHEAVKEVESEADDGIIVDELQSGFILNGKVIRPSQVIISKKKTDD
jgi:molecular chaperone GrpE